jgi:acetyltransferase
MIIPTIKESKKPVVVSLMGNNLVQKGNALLRDANIPDYEFPETAASALAVLEKYAREKGKSLPVPVPRKEINKKQAEQLMDEVKISPDGFIDEITVNKICEAYGIPVMALFLSKSPDEAAEIAEQIGFPVAMKIASPEISHKSDSGGLLLNIGNAQEVKSGYVKITESVKKWDPVAEITGVYIQKMITDGQEVIIGGLQDTQFGAMVMFGSGGVDVEARKDVAFSIAPVTEEDLNHIMKTTGAGKKLKGFRNIPPGDIEAVKESLIRLGYLLSDFPQIKEAEINPLMVLPKSEGAFAVDIRFRIE